VKAGFDPAGTVVAGSGLAAAEAAQSITTAQAASLGGMVVTPLSHRWRRSSCRCASRSPPWR
jgi:hypothetical protein